jgi:hypothetical protein
MNRNIIFKIVTVLFILAVFITIYLLKNKNSDTPVNKAEIFPAMVDYGSHG